MARNKGARMPMRMDIRKFMEEKQAQEQQRNARRARQNNSQQQPRAEAADPSRVPENQPRAGPSNREDQSGPSSRPLRLFPRDQAEPAPAERAAAEPAATSPGRQNAENNAQSTTAGEMNVSPVVDATRVSPAVIERRVRIVTVQAGADRRYHSRNGFRRSRRSIIHTRIGRAGISQYQADMPERILQSPQESAPEAPTGKVTVSDIELVSREGKSFPCCKALLEKMCLYFNVCWKGWKFPVMQLGGNNSATERLVKFVRDGTITIDADCVFDLLGMSDYMGFECLRRICVHYMSLEDYPVRDIVMAHGHLSHLEDLSEAFFTKAVRIPLALYHGPEGESYKSTLISMTFHQLKQVLASDRLVVTSEDEVVLMIEEWLKHNNATEKHKEALLSVIRYQFLTPSMGRWLNDSTSAFPPPKIENVASSNHCGRRAGYDTHVHILWKENRTNNRGPENLAVSCVSWNKNLRKLKEQLLMRVPIDRDGSESRYGIQFAVSGRKLVRTSSNHSDDKIFISEVDLKTGKRMLKRTIKLFPLRIVDRPEMTIVKESSDLTLCYHDGSSEIRTVDTNTWRETRAKQVVPAAFDMHPWQLQLFSDCVIGLDGSRIIISRPRFENPTEVQLQPTEGKYVDFERVGDLLFVLEDTTLYRMVDQGARDLVHVIRVEARQHLETVYLPESQIRERRADHPTPDHVSRFLRTDTDLFVVQQADSDMAVRITSVNVETFEVQVAAILQAPNPVKYEPEEIHNRQFLGAVPPSFMSCDKFSLKDLELSFVPSR